MVIDSYSFLKKIIGRNAYNEIKEYARKIIPIATCILVALWGLSFIFHWGVISSLLDITTGTSLIFVAYILGLIVLLDKGIDVVLEESNDRYSRYSFPQEEPVGFKKTIVRGVVLIIFGLAAIIVSNNYRNQYAFECDTFLVDHKHQIYHLDCNNRCEIAREADGLEKMKGYEIEESYTICYWCKEWAEDAEDEYNANRYYRK